MLTNEATEIAKVFITPVYAEKAITFTSLSHSKYTSRRAKGNDTCFIGVDGYLDKEERQVHSFCMLESDEVSAPYAFAVLAELYFPSLKKKEALIFLFFKGLRKA